MLLEHKFSVPVPIAHAWDVLLDVERIAPCMPGATVESFDGETIVGRVKVKVGPIQVTYAGTAEFVEKDEAGRRATIEAAAKESRGTGTAKATIVAVLLDAGESQTDVTVTTDLAITGKPAQFGRGVMAEVGNKILGKFADCLAGQLGGDDAVGAGAGTAAAGGGADASGPATAAEAIATTTSEVGTPATPARTPMRPVPDNDAIDLLDTAGPPVLKRLAPILGGLTLLILVWRLVRRR